MLAVGLADRLVASVRAEFRAEELTFPVNDPVFGGGACVAAGCKRSARSYGMCCGHYQRWVDAGRPPMTAFLAATPTMWRRQQANARCRAVGCGYGVCRTGLCQLHFQRWQRAGRPPLPAWLADPPAVKAPRGERCRVPHCQLWPQAASELCHAHQATGRANGRPALDRFVEGFRPRVRTRSETIELAGLGQPLTLQIQYALQHRRDEVSASKLDPEVVRRTVATLSAHHVGSLLDRDEPSWRAWATEHLPRDGGARAFLLYAHRAVADLLQAGGWEGEFARDVWLMRRLAHPGNETLDFTGIPQPWLRELVKRWVRGRLAAELSLETVRRGLRTMTAFAVFCQRIGVTGLADVDRGVLERYLAELHTQWAGRGRHNDHITQLGLFLEAVRQHRWDENLPALALLFRDDQPKRPRLLPRAVSEVVMAQLEHLDNLDRFGNPSYRLVTVILMRCGLRVTDALTLPRDCVVADAEGAPTCATSTTR